MSKMHASQSLLTWRPDGLTVKCRLRMRTYSGMEAVLIKLMPCPRRPRPGLDTILEQAVSTSLDTSTRRRLQYVTNAKRKRRSRSRKLSQRDASVKSRLPEFRTDRMMIDGSMLIESGPRTLTIASPLPAWGPGALSPGALQRPMPSSQRRPQLRWARRRLHSQLTTMHPSFMLVVARSPAPPTVAPPRRKTQAIGQSCRAG